MKAAVADCRALYARHSRRCGLELIDIRLPPKWLCGAFGSGVREHIPTHHRDPPDTPPVDVQVRGRSPGLRVAASVFTFPGPHDPSGFSERTLAAYSCGGSSGIARPIMDVTHRIPVLAPDLANRENLEH